MIEFGHDGLNLSRGNGGEGVGFWEILPNEPVRVFSYRFMPDGVTGA